jgi:hypothetical protein
MRRITAKKAATGRAVKDLLRTQEPDLDWERELTELRGAVRPVERLPAGNVRRKRRR